jgi:hypothetical protein
MGVNGTKPHNPSWKPAYRALETDQRPLSVIKANELLGAALGPCPAGFEALAPAETKDGEDVG